MNKKNMRILNFVKDGFHGLCMACADSGLLFSVGKKSENFRQIENQFSEFLAVSSDSNAKTGSESFSLNINGISFVKKPLSVHGENYSLLIFGIFDWHENKGNEAVFKILLAGIVLLVFAAVLPRTVFLRDLS